MIYQRLSKNKTSNKRMMFLRSRTRKYLNNNPKVFGPDIKLQLLKEERNKKKLRGSRQKQRHLLKRRKG